MLTARFTDRAAPSLSNIAISSTGQPGYATIANSVSITFTVSEVLTSDPTVRFNFDRTSSAPSGNLVKSDLTYTASVTITALWPPSNEDGLVTFSIAFTDAALNAGVTFLSTTASYTGNVIVGG